MTDDRHVDCKAATRHMACDEVGLDEQFGVWTLGFGRTDASGDTAEYVTLQSRGEGDDDWGPYFEVDDQYYGGYNLVRQITLGDGRIEFSLTGELGADRATRIVVTFADTRENSEAVAQGLELVFEDQLDALISKSPQPQP